MTDPIEEPSDIQSPSFVIHTLGHFDVIKDGRSLVMSSSGSKKIWELYKFMLTHRERSFTPETLMDQLWSSENYNDLRNTLRRQMHRLRQALLEEECKVSDRTLLFSNGHYRWNDRLHIQLDTDLFENLVKRGDALKDTSIKESLESYRQAVNLYGGDYLQECIESHWTFPIRTHYRRLFLKAAVNGIDLLKQEEAYDDILLLCEKVIQLDIYEETFHLRFMEALSAKGDKRRALQHYEYITGFYYREMGLKPSPEMIAVYKTLQKAQSNVISDESLYNELASMVPPENAYYCEPEVFKSIYELECRRCERSGISISIGVVTVNPITVYIPSQEELRMNHLKQHLMEHLRKGDTFTRWNSQQLVVLLPGVDSVLTEKVLKRVLNAENENPSIVIKQITHLTPEPKHNRFV